MNINMCAIAPWFDCFCFSSPLQLSAFQAAIKPSFSCILQVWLLRAAAYGVLLASIRPGWAWLPRSTAHGASLGSTKLDQVFLILIYCSPSIYLHTLHIFQSRHDFFVCAWNLIFDLEHWVPSQSRSYALHDGARFRQVWSRRIPAHGVLRASTKLGQVHTYFLS